MDNPPASNGLSDRELEVLHLVATGASNKEIALALSISQNTVKVHLRNIFSKTGATSRTEAAMYAVRLGLVGGVASDQPVPVSEVDPASTPTQTSGQTARTGQTVWANPWVRFGLPLLFLILAIAAGFGLLNDPTPATALPSPAPVVSPPRWQAEADLPVARSGLAVAVYENQIYAIAGQTGEAVVGTLTRYQPEANRWETLEEKPTPVTDMAAGVVGGRIYVPGGLQADQNVTSVMEIYDPRQGTWMQGLPMPVALSAYALVAFEGRIYLFGGWDGERYVADVHVYDPTLDDWLLGTPMPTARGFSGAAVVGDRIYIIGGRDQNGPLAANEEYAPDLDGSGELPWRELASMPEARFGIGAAGIANVVHVFGGEGAVSDPEPWKYFPTTDTWQPFEKVDDSLRSFMGLVAVETSIHMIGGLQNGTPSPDHLAYQAIFTIAIPVIPQP